jgi:hypothetical protein
MPTRFFQQLSRIARGPQGRRLAEEAKRLAKDPATRKRIDEARRRVMSRGRPS